MQDFATLTSEEKITVLNSMDEESDYVLADDRDSNSNYYYITKLNDGNVWMTQNLDLDIIDNGSFWAVTLDSTNTDVPENWNDTLYDTYYSEGIDSFYSYWDESSNTSPKSIDPGSYCLADDGTFEYCNTPQDGPNHYHIGNYYTWTAAVAMEDSYRDDIINDEVMVDQSICPAGWTLPTTSSNAGPDSYENMLTGYMNDFFADDPLYFIPSGYFNGEYFDLLNEGFYWSIEANGDFYSEGLSANFVNFYNNEDIDIEAAPRHYGLSVRCVLR